MDDSFSEVLTYQLKKSLPLICTTILILIAYIPIHIPFSKYLRADIGMICIYFWALYRRDLLGPISVVCLGLIADSLSVVPFGVNIFIFMLIYVLAITYGSFVNTKPFIVCWIGFAIIACSAFFAKWLLLSVYYSKFLSPLGVFMGLVSTILLYPLVARFNVFIQNKLLSDEEVIYE